MKAKELMIGDMVKWKEQEGFTDEDRKMVLRVSQVQEGKIWIEGRYGPYAESLFEPIRITEEMLLQWGLGSMARIPMSLNSVALCMIRVISRIIK